MPSMSKRLPIVGKCGDRKVVKQWTRVSVGSHTKDLLNYSWFLTAGYPSCHYPGVKVVQYLHRIIYKRKHGEIPDGQEIDHIDRDKLNNTDQNLRCVTYSVNLAHKPLGPKNKSGYKGVSRHSKNKKWIASIGVNGTVKYLGSFDCPIEAAKVFNEEFCRKYPTLEAPNKL